LYARIGKRELFWLRTLTDDWSVIFAWYSSTVYVVCSSLSFSFFSFLFSFFSYCIFSVCCLVANKDLYMAVMHLSKFGGDYFYPIRRYGHFRNSNYSAMCSLGCRLVWVRYLFDPFDVEVYGANFNFLKSLSKNVEVIYIDSHNVVA